MASFTEKEKETTETATNEEAESEGEDEGTEYSLPLPQLQGGRRTGFSPRRSFSTTLSPSNSTVSVMCITIHWFPPTTTTRAPPGHRGTYFPGETLKNVLYPLHKPKTTTHKNMKESIEYWMRSIVLMGRGCWVAPSSCWHLQVAAWEVEQCQLDFVSACFVP